MRGPPPSRHRCGRRPERIGAAAVLALGTCLCAETAWAHGNLPVGDFYTGMLHPLLHLEALLPTLGLALWAGQLESPAAWQIPLLFLATAGGGTGLGLLGVALPPARAVLLLSMPTVGLLVAARRGVPFPVAALLAAAVGVCDGQTNTYDPGGQIQQPVLFAAGLAMSFGLIFFHVVSRVHRHRAFWVQTGVRVVGSWIAAIGLLVTVLEWVGPQ